MPAKHKWKFKTIGGYKLRILQCKHCKLEIPIGNVIQGNLRTECLTPLERAVRRRTQHE